MILSFGKPGDAHIVREALLEDIPQEQVRLSQSKGFDGVASSDLMVLALTLSPLVLKKLGDVLIKIIESRGAREVVVNGTKIKGYSLEQVMEVLEKTGTGNEETSSETKP